MDEILVRLDALDRKLDYVVERQRYVEELVDEMTPVAREAVNSMAAELAQWEARGWFTMGREAVDQLDRFAQVLHRSDTLAPVGMMGALRATARDAEVQRGLAIALELLRQLGQARHGDATAPPTRQLPPTAPAPRPAVSRPAAPRPAAPATPAPPPPTETVVWEGRTFTTEGFLVDGDSWDEALAAKVAAGLGIALTDEHWQVLRWARDDYAAAGASPNVRRMAAGSGVGTRRLYELFPGTPGKAAAMIAGLPKPVGCL